MAVWTLYLQFFHLNEYFHFFGNKNVNCDAIKFKCNKFRWNTFYREGSCAAGYSKLVPCNARVKTSIRFSCVPNPKVTFGQNGDPAAIKTNESNQFFPQTLGTITQSILGCVSKFKEHMYIWSPSKSYENDTYNLITENIFLSFISNEGWFKEHGWKNGWFGAATAAKEGFESGM